ncbi:hypothetical protein I3760_11G129900 [Carya illinoinensis]|nr:hypothetical protein I3760_11G129900 [Carya illinoinensis]
MFCHIMLGRSDSIELNRYDVGSGAEVRKRVPADGGRGWGFEVGFDEVYWEEKGARCAGCSDLRASSMASKQILKDLKDLQMKDPPTSCSADSTDEGLKGVEGDLENRETAQDSEQTIHQKHQEGDIFDCVDIYKQPAFDHPLLKNHSIQMKPNFFPERGEDKTLPHVAKTSAVGLSEGCPFGTVPIKRTRKEDLLLAKMFVKDSGSNIASPPTHVNAGENGCFNMLCSGFVQVSSKDTPGYVLDEVSRYGRKQFSVKFHVVKDVREGNWWLAQHRTSISFLLSSTCSAAPHVKLPFVWRNDEATPFQMHWHPAHTKSITNNI